MRQRYFELDVELAHLLEHVVLEVVFDDASEDPELVTEHELFVCISACLDLIDKILAHEDERITVRHVLRLLLDGMPLLKVALSEGA